MCGFCGFTGDGNREELEKMTDTLLHRGPDDAGYFFESGKIGLGFRRLSIIDLANGNQPLSNESGKVHSVMNGEIYNYKGLRSFLANHKFITAGDSEVIPHMYEECGVQLFEKLHGMFAIAIWDSEKERLILARDRFGKKPLYYYAEDGIVVFSSEPKAILKHHAVKKELNVGALNLYLTHEYVPAPYSMFKNIHKVEPGTYVVFENGKLTTHSFYSPQFNTVEVPANKKIVFSKFDELFTQAVEKRLMSDVPLGVFLSGGLDSSAISYVVRKKLGRSLDTFSIGFRDKSFDESIYASEVAEYLGTNHHLKTYDADDLVNILEEIGGRLDEPCGDSAILPNYLLSKFAKEFVTVVLGGDGSDEILSGYPTFYAQKLGRVYDHVPDFIRRVFVEPTVNSLPVSRNNISFDYKLKRFITGAREKTWRRNTIWIGSFAPNDKQKLLLPHLRNELIGVNEFEIPDRYYLDVINDVPNSQFTYEYIKTYLSDDILFVKDRASMLASLEVRNPFLDHLLVDYVNSLPEKYKLRNLTTKYILKKVMADKLPENIINRAKKGFGSPIAKWIAGPLRPNLHEFFGEKYIREQGIFDYSEIQRLISDHMLNIKDNRKEIWTLIMFQKWYQNWMQ